MPPFVRPVLVLVAAAALLAMAGCRRGPEGATEVVVIGDRQPALGDPMRPPTNEADAVLRMAIAQGLVRFDPAGQIEPGVAERWNVSDDGLSYIFRLETGEWADGRKIMARDVARLIDRELKSDRDHPSRDALGAVDEVVAMTDRVIELRLRSPRPNLLTLLAQPEFALIREGVGTGPFRKVEDAADRAGRKDAPLHLRRRLPGIDGEEGEREDVLLGALPAERAIQSFLAGRTALVLGGTVGDLPLAQRVKLPRGSLRFDPVGGLFGLAPARSDGPAGDAELRRLLSQAIDRDALIAALAVPGLAPRATLLQGGLAGLAVLPQPTWLGQPVAERRAALVAAAQQLRKAGADRQQDEPVVLAITLPGGPGGDLVLMRLNADWGPLGFEAVRAGAGRRADFRWVDSVAPSDSPAWFVRQFRCAVTPVCLPEAEELLAAARETAIAAQRSGLLAEVARRMDEAQLFLPVAAPIRWSLVSKDARGFTENRYARHPLGGIAAQSDLGARR